MADPRETRVLLAHAEDPALRTIEGYKRLAGGYAPMEKAYRELEQDEVLKELEDSGLRGRGGAGFSMGKKASFLPRGDKAREAAIKHFEHFIKTEGQTLLGWRDVPINLEGLGTYVIETMPVPLSTIEELIVSVAVELLLARIKSPAVLSAPPAVRTMLGGLT